MKNDRAKYLAKNTLVFAIGNIASKFITFFLVPLYTSALSTTEYGIVDEINVWCLVLSPILMLNINESVMRFALDKDAEYSKILSSGIICYGFEIVVALLVIPISGAFESTRGFGLLIYLFTIASSGSSLFLSYLRGIESVTYYAIGNVVQTLSIAALNIFYLLVLHQGIIGYLKAYIIAMLITMVYAIVAGRVIKELKSFKFDKTLTVQMLKYSVVLIPNTFMWWIMNSSDRIMVISMVGVAANGIYAISYKLPSLVSTTMTVFNQAWHYSAIKEEGADDEEEYNNKIFRTVVCVTIIAGLMIISLSKPFLRIYVTPNYYSAWKYIPFLTIGSVYLTLASFIATCFTVHKDSFGYLFSGVFGAVINILLNILLIPVIDVYGAAIATCVSYISVFLFRIFYTRKYIYYETGNIQFVGGTVLLILDSIMAYCSNLWAQIVQIIIVFIALLLFRPIWIPLFNSIIHIITVKIKNWAINGKGR